MTNKPNDGGPAKDKSLRDWFAGQAMAGILLDAGHARNIDDQTIAASSYRLADVMLAEREKER